MWSKIGKFLKEKSLIERYAITKRVSLNIFIGYTENMLKIFKFKNMGRARCKRDSLIYFFLF